MRPLLFLLASLALGFPLVASGPAVAVEYPWCAEFADGAGSNCGFPTYEQCMQTARGTGGFCVENTFYKGPPAPAERPRHVPRKPRAPKKD